MNEMERRTNQDTDPNYLGDVPHKFQDSPNTISCGGCGETYEHQSHQIYEQQKRIEAFGMPDAGNSGSH